MKHLKRVVTMFCMLLVFTVPGIVAQQEAQREAQRAVIRDMAGIVEIKEAGSTAWEGARRGQALAGNTVISTGFRSTALLALGNSLLTVRPLTRLSIVELSKKQDTEQADFSLQTGRVRAEVYPPLDSKIEFTVRSSAATASVRGTIFEFDTLYLLVIEGTVEFSGPFEIPVLIDAVGSSYLDERTSKVTLPRAASAAELRPDLPIAAETVRPAFWIIEPGLHSSSGKSDSGLQDLSANIWF